MDSQLRSDKFPKMSPPDADVAPPEILKQLLQIIPQGLTDPETNILAYIGGYIIKKLKDKICQTCIDKSVANEDGLGHQHRFIRGKNIPDCQQGLVFPSILFTGYVQLLEIVFRKVIEKCISGNDMKKNFSSCQVKLM